MAIHHMIIKSAEKLGFSLEERGDNVRAFHPSLAVEIFGVSGKDAMNQMISFLNTHKRNPDLRFIRVEGQPVTLGRLRQVNNPVYSKQIGTPTTLYHAYANDEIEWANADADFDDRTSNGEKGLTLEETFDHKPEITDPTPVVKRDSKGVPLDGATAYREGIPAADNPYEEGTDECDQWFEDWDAAADAAEPVPEEERTGSVVASKYRAKYQEMGHPTHCGDWLAELLNNYCVGKKSTDLDTLEMIFAQNGVDTSKYNRTTPGWQGRIRMTGRNLLARKVFNVGFIWVPATGDDMVEKWMKIEAPADWIAAQRYSKPKAE